MSEMLIKKEENAPKMTKIELAKKLASIKERDHELVTGIFNYKEKPRGKLCFTFQKYADDNNKKYELVDGQRYRIPRMVAKHLNQNCYYVEYTRAGGAFAGSDVHLAGTGNESTYANMYAVNKLHRTEFRSLEFMDDDLDAPSNITEIAYL